MPDIYISYGENPCDMTMELMKTADIAARLPANAKVCIKPNLVVSRPASGGATTHPEIVEGIIQYLRKAEVRDIVIAEGAWVGDSTRRAFDACGYTALSRRYNVPLLDTKNDSVQKLAYNGLELSVCESVLKADYLINVPVLKGHCQTNMTCCLKNMKGCIPDSEKRRYHTMGLHRPIAALNAALRPHLHIVDSICGDLSFEEGGNPVDSGRVMLGFDPVLLDSYGARLMGYHPDEIGHLRLAKSYGIGEYADDATEIVELNPDARPKTTMPHSGTVKRLAAHIDEDSACSACYAALIFALNRSGAPSREKIKIGQGFRGKTQGGIGVGNCTSGCNRFAKGCPPSALDIADFLESI